MDSLSFAIMHIISIVRYFLNIFTRRALSLHQKIQSLKIYVNQIIYPKSMKKLLFCFHFAKPPCSLTDAL